MLRRLLLIGLAALISGTQPELASARDRVVLMATQPVTLGGTESIDTTGIRGAFRGIRLAFKSGETAEISEFKIHYGDGTTYTHERGFTLRRGEQTRMFDTKSGDRFVDAVQITTRGSGTTVLEVEGSQSSKGGRMARAEPPVPRTPVAAPSAPERPVAEPPVAPAPRRAVPAGAEKEPGVLFGYQKLETGADRQVLKVGPERGKFARIRFAIADNDLEIDKVAIVYDSGESEVVPLDVRVAAGRKSPWIELDGERFIREIELTSRPDARRRGPARVEVSGQYSRDWLAARGEGAKHNEGWVLLGAQAAGFTGFDRDVIEVGENEGGFRRLRVTALERTITLREIKVKFRDGTDKVFKMNEAVEPGAAFGPLEFDGVKAPIRSIEARYRSRFGIAKGLSKILDPTPAVVQIWAHH